MQRSHFQLVGNVQRGAHDVHVERQHGWQPGQAGHDVAVQRVEPVQVVDEQHQRGRAALVLEPFQQRLEPIADVQRVERRVQRHAQPVGLEHARQLLAYDPQQFQVVRGAGRDAGEPDDAHRLLVEPLLALAVNGGEDGRLAGAQAAAHHNRAASAGRHDVPYFRDHTVDGGAGPDPDHVPAVGRVHDRLLEHLLDRFVPGVQLGPLFDARVDHALHLGHDRLLEYGQVHVVLGMFTVDTSGFPFHAKQTISLFSTVTFYFNRSHNAETSKM